MSLGYYRALMNRQQAPYFLDTYSGALYAVSDRQLANGVSGGTVRESTGGTTTSLVFGSDRKPDATVLESFAGAGDATIQQLDDQTGNGRHATASTSVQPLIVESGTITKGNGAGANSETCIYYDDSLQYLTNSYNAGASYSLFIVAQVNLPHSDAAVLFDTNTASTRNNLFKDNSSGTPSPRIQYNASSNINTGVNFSGDLEVISIIKTSSSLVDIYRNETKITSGGTATRSLNGITIGSNRSKTIPYLGYIGTVVVYSGDKTSDVSGIVTELKALYNIT